MVAIATITRRRMIPSSIGMRRVLHRHCRRHASTTTQGPKPVPGSSHLHCGECDFKAYRNPKLVVGCVATHGGESSASTERMLLVRRAISPRCDMWTLPAGYMELGETAEVGAAREAREEANASVVVTTLLAAFSVPRLSQVVANHSLGVTPDPGRHGAGPTVVQRQDREPRPDPASRRRGI